MLTRNSEEWKSEYEERGALWIHDPQKPTGYHAELTSGLHSNGFFFSKPVIEDESLLASIAHDLAFLFLGPIGTRTLDCVVGPQTGATKLAELLAAKFTQLFGRPIVWCSPAKFQEGSVKKMIIDDADHPVIENGLHLLCDDVITTAGSIDIASELIKSQGGFVLPESLCLVDRSSIIDRKIFSLIKHPMPQWKPEECPLCAEGSKPIKPKKTPENWALLTGK